MADTITRKHNSLEKTVKDTVDFVYEFLSPFKDGCAFSARDTGNQGRYVVRTLLRRGIISMKKLPGGKTHYTWVADMAPTKVLYKSVAAEIRDQQREKNKKYKAQKVVAQTTENAEDAKADERKESVGMEPITPPNLLKVFSDQELWDELKARGYGIEGNRLCVVKKEYLD